MGTCEMKATEAATEVAVDPDSMHTTVAIVSARGLRNADCWVSGKSDCFAVLKVVDSDLTSRELYKTKVKNDTLDPVWKEEVVIPALAEGQQLEFCVFDADVMGLRDSLGQVSLPHSVLAKEGFNGELKLENAGQNQLAYLRVKVKHKGQDYPPGPPPEVQITLTREDPQILWGISLDSQDCKVLYVDKVEDKGPVRTFNEGVEPAMQLKGGDYIVAVNGEKGCAHQLLELLKAETKAELVVRRAEEFRAKCAKENINSKNGLKDVFRGLVLRRTPQGTCLLVIEVKEDWKPLEEEDKVRVLDRIIAIGDTRGPADVLMKELNRKATSQEVTFCRPAVPPEH